MKYRDIVALDVDETVLNFSDAVINYFKYELERDLNKVQISDYSLKNLGVNDNIFIDMYNKGYIDNLEPVSDDTVGCIKKLRNYGYRVVFVTSRALFGSDMVKFTRKQLKSIGLDVFNDDIFVTGECNITKNYRPTKEKVFEDLGGVHAFLDDHYDNFIKASNSEYCNFAYLKSSPWNWKYKQNCKFAENNTVGGLKEFTEILCTGY